jgi:hypothetical protein
MFCFALLWCKILNLFINIEWAIKLLYLGMSLLCENIVRVEENWMNRFICSGHCSKGLAADKNVDDDSESFDDFIKKINSTQHSGPPAPRATPAALPPGPFNSAQVSTLNFPNPSLAQTGGNNTAPRSAGSALAPARSGEPVRAPGPDDVDHEKIKRLIDKLYMKTIVEKSENSDEDNDDDIISLSDERDAKKAAIADRIARHLSRGHEELEFNNRIRRQGSSPFQRKNSDPEDDTTNRIFSRNGSDDDNKQIIFSRGLREVDNFIPQPN